MAAWLLSLRAPVKVASSSRESVLARNDGRDNRDNRRDKSDMIEHVITINAEKIKVTGNKLESKYYSRHSGYPGGFREEKLSHLLERRPEEVVRRAVKGMVPHTRLGTQQLRKLKVYATPDHPHEAQRPETEPTAAGGANS